MTNLILRLCDVHPSGESLRVSHGVHNLAHRDGHETPAPLAVGAALPGAYPAQRCGLRIPGWAQGVGSRSPAAYWPMIWPSAEKATLLIFGGTLDLPLRPPRAADAQLSPLPGTDSAPPEEPTVIHCDDMRVSSELTASAWNWAQRANPGFTSEWCRSAQARTPRKTDPNHVAGRMANSYRDGNARLLMHARCLPAAGEIARLGGRDRSL